MAKNEAKNTPVTGTVAPELREALEAYRWENRMTVSEVVREALEVWASSKGITVETATDEGVTKDKAKR